MSVKFSVGDSVRVKHLFPPGHCRTPHYCRGKQGRVVKYCGDFRNPEKLAYGNLGAEHVALYRVQFAHPELWPQDNGSANDRVEIEIFEHWLESE
jgi:nitrile hydratase